MITIYCRGLLIIWRREEHLKYILANEITMNSESIEVSQKRIILQRSEKIQKSQNTTNTQNLVITKVYCLAEQSETFCFTLVAKSQ